MNLTIVCTAFIILFAGLMIVQMYKLRSIEKFQNKSTICISLTTSPKRIFTIESTLISITNDQLVKPDVVYLNLPKTFKRTGESYVIPDFIKRYPEVVINRVDDDEGPGTKLIPTLRAVTDPETIIIILDDDIRYDSNLVKRMVDALTNSKDDILVANICYNIHGTQTSCEIAEGYGSFAFRRKIFRSDFFDYLKNVLKNNDCFRSDDYYISNYLNKYNVEKRNLNVFPDVLKIGTQEDALHVIDSSDDRYKRCRNYLASINENYIS